VRCRHVDAWVGCVGPWVVKDLVLDAEKSGPSCDRDAREVALWRPDWHTSGLADGTRSTFTGTLKKHGGVQTSRSLGIELRRADAETAANALVHMQRDAGCGWSMGRGLAIAMRGDFPALVQPSRSFEASVTTDRAPVSKRHERSADRSQVELDHRVSVGKRLDVAIAMAQA